MGRRIYNFFFNTDMPMWRYVVRSGVISLIPSMVVSFFLAQTGVMTEENAPDLEVGGPLAIFIGIVIFSPVIETFLMASGIWLLSFITQRPLRLALLSAILWAALHSLLSPPWGIGILWPFFVFSCAYLAWRKKTWWRAIWVTVCIHAFQNFFPGLAVIFATT